MRRKGAALARFATLLDSNRKARELTYAALARAIDSPREKSQGRAAAGTIANWCKGTALPTEIEPLLRALFGSDRNSNAPAREALRNAFEAALAERHGTVIAGAAANPGAGAWAIDGEPKFVPDPTAHPEDQHAAAAPLRVQMQQVIRRLAARLTAACGPQARGRFDNSEYFKELPAAAAEFQAEIDREPGELAGRLGAVYPLLQQLARYRETDDDVRRQDSDAELDPNTRGALLDLVRTVAPWARGFPTVVQWDDDAGRLLAEAAHPRSPETIVVAARTRHIIGTADAGRLQRLVAMADKDAPLGRKLGNRAIAEADNLILALAGLSAAALAGAAAPAHADLARRSGATLADATDYVTSLAAGRPADLREALLALAASGRRLERDGPAVAGSHAVELLPNRALEPVPDDVEEQALAMILDGQPPPAHWRPYIRRLFFPDGRFNRANLLVGLGALRFLGLDNTQIGDATPLAGLSALQTLWLGRTEIGDVTPLAGLSALQALHLGSTQIGDVTPLAGLSALQTLYLAGTQIGDVTPLAGLSALQFLYLGHTQIGDVAPLAGLSALQELDLGRSKIVDATPLAGLSALRTLGLDNTRIGNVTPFAGLRALRFLDLSNTQVGDVAPLAGLSALQTLHLGNTQIGDVAPLAGLGALQFLDLSNTQIADVAPLAGLGNLRQLYIANTPVRDVAVLEHIEGLEIIGGPGPKTSGRRGRRT